MKTNYTLLLLFSLLSLAGCKSANQDEEVTQCPNELIVSIPSIEVDTDSKTRLDLLVSDKTRIDIFHPNHRYFWR